MKKQSTANQESKNQLVLSMLENCTFDGWNNNTLQQSAKKLSIQNGELDLLFPLLITDVTNHFSFMVTEEMDNNIKKISLSDMKIRERIYQLVLSRINAYERITSDNREAIRSINAFLTLHPKLSLSLLYKTTDHMWNLAGDKSKDYNFYTKRIILGAVFSSTLLFWLDDTSDNSQKTQNFLQRRIDNVMAFEKQKAQWKKTFSNLSAC